MAASVARPAHSGGLAWTRRVEVLAGIAGFILALVTWTLQLFAPLYEWNGYCISCHPRYGRTSVVDSVRGLGNFVGYYPGRGIGQLILAFLVLTGIVALGAYLHGGRDMAAGRWLVWGGSLLEALALPAVVYTLITLPLPLTPVMPFQIVPRGDTLLLGLGLGAGLAVITSMTAGWHRVAEVAAGDGMLAARSAGAEGVVWAAWVEVLAGAAAFAFALVIWAILLFAPLYQDVSSCDQFGCQHLLYVNLMEGLGGLGTFIKQHLSVVLLILVFLVAAGMVGIGAYLHGGRRVAAGRWAIWGGSVLMLVSVSATSELAPPSLLASHLVARHLFPYQTWFGGGTISGVDLLTVVVGPGLCAALAVITSVAATRAEDARRRATG